MTRTMRHQGGGGRKWGRIARDAAIGGLLIALLAAACSKLRHRADRWRLAPEVVPSSLERYVVAQPVARLSLPGVPRNMTLSGSALYVPMMDQGLATVDVSDPEHPRLASHLSSTYERSPTGLPHYYMSVLADGKRLLAVDRHNGVTVLDASDPLRPTYRWTYHLPRSDVSSLTRVGESIYLTEGAVGLKRLPAEFDARTTASLVLDQVCYAKNSAFYPPHYLLLADHFDNGMQILSIEDALHPKPVHIFVTGDICDEVLAFRGFAALVNRNQGIMVVDLKNIDEPRLASYFKEEGVSLITCLAAWRGDRLLVGYMAGFIDVLDLRDPYDCRWLARIPTGGSTRCMAIEDDYLFVGTPQVPADKSQRGNHQLEIYRLIERGGSKS